MTVIEYLVALLGPLVANRVFVNTTDDANAQTYPMIIIQKTGGEDSWYLEGELPSNKHARITVTVWGERAIEVETLIEAVDEKMVHAPYATQPYGASVANFEDAFNAYTERKDYGIWFPRSL